MQTRRRRLGFHRRHSRRRALRETPDVQGAVEKMFSHGKIWLDTSIVLPLLAEPLFDGQTGRFTRMLEASHEAKLELFVTWGVIEEIERHMNRSNESSMWRKFRRRSSNG